MPAAAMSTHFSHNYLSAAQRRAGRELDQGGDENASGGQADVRDMLKEAGVLYQSATWDATWSAEEYATAAKNLFAPGDDINFATLKTGTVLETSDSSSSSSGPAMNSKHMASFEPAYRITALPTGSSKVA
jgi:hypothetical protein